MHTTLSAHPFKIDLPPGKYTVTAERGKEYRPLTKSIDMTDKPQDLRLPLECWINVAAHGWYSGDTHVHRTVEDLPNIMLAEDLNVTFPLTYWVTKAYEKPSQGNKNTQDKYGTDLIKIDDTHVIYPRNTEYEIFTVDGKRHTLGAVFVLGHKKVLDFGAPPVEAYRRGPRRGGSPPPRSGQTQLALVDGHHAAAQGGLVRAFQQSPVAHEVRLHELGGARAALHEAQLPRDDRCRNGLNALRF